MVMAKNKPALPVEERERVINLQNLPAASSRKVLFFNNVPLFEI